MPLKDITLWEQRGFEGIAHGRAPSPDAARAFRSGIGRAAPDIGEAGAQIAGIHARVGSPDAKIVGLAGKLGAGANRHRKPRAWTCEEGLEEQHLRLGGQARRDPQPRSTPRL